MSLRPWLRRGLASAVFGWVGAAAGASTAGTLQPLLEAANAAAPEFTAMALLRVSQNAERLDTPARIALITQAFEAAGKARTPMPRRATVEASERGDVPDDSAPLDRLSLQAQAVIALSRLDAAAAQRLFAAIPPPALGPVACVAQRIQSPLPFYEAAAVLRARLPAAEQVAGARQLLSSASHETQVAPALAAWLGAARHAQPADWPLAAKAITGLLQRARGDDPSFSVTWRAADTVFWQVLAAPQFDAASRSALTQGYRVYLIDHFSRLRCPHNASGQNFALEQNALRTTWKGLEIPGSAHRAASDVASPQDVPPESPDHDLLTRAVALGTSEYDRAMAEGTPTPAAWSAQLESLLHDIEESAYEPDDAAGTRRLLRLRALAELRPAVAANDTIGVRLLGMQLRELAQSALLRVDPTEWYGHLRALADGCRASHGRAGEVTFVRALAQTRQPAMVLEAALMTAWPNTAGLLSAR